MISSNLDTQPRVLPIQYKIVEIIFACFSTSLDLLIKQKFPVQLIFSGEYTKAMSKDWHSGHFCCWNCDESLTGQRYVLRDEHPYCIKCYESVFANTCEECSKLIGIDSKVGLCNLKNLLKA